MFLVTDITSFMDSFVAMLFTGLVDCFNILDSITFHNISLLDFILGILLLGFIIPIIINLVKPSVSSARADYKKRRD